MIDDVDLPDDFLVDIVSEVETERDNNEPSCLTKLRTASELDFRYEILGEVDQGGMKRIFKAIDKKTRRYVALAFIKSDKLSEKDLRYFIQEAWITARLEHPNIVPIHDIGLDPEGTPYFAMKLLSGENLRTILSKLKDGDELYSAKFPVRHLLDIFQKICDAISYAHQCGVVHLDLKPDNIQISDFGEVLVMDWGISNLTKNNIYPDDDGESCPTVLSDLQQTIFGAIKGTPGYIAPELIENTRSSADHKADIYGLGAILYSLLTYRRPRHKIPGNTTRSGDIANHEFVKQQYPPGMDIPPALKAVIDHAMRSVPEKRYASVDDLKNDIEAHLAGHATQAEEASFLRHQILMVKRHARVFMTITAALIAVLIVTGIFTLRLAVSQKQAIKNEQRALRQEKIVMEREAEALVLVKKYQDEKKERERREKTSVKFYLTSATTHFYHFRPKKAWEDIEEALRLNPKDDKVIQMAEHIHIAEQKFNGLLKLFPRERKRGKYRLAAKYGKIKPDSRLLNKKELVDYIDDLSKTNTIRHRSVTANIFFKINKGKRFSKHQKYMQGLIDKITPHTQLIYDEATDRVTLVGNNPQTLTLLAGMRFKGLDLSQYRVTDSRLLTPFKKLEYLNLKDADLKQFRVIYRMKNLKYLNLEGALIYNLDKAEEIIKLDYLNLARTTLRWYPTSIFRTKLLNVADAHDMNLMTFLTDKYAPKTVIVSRSQLDDYPKFLSKCNRLKIKVIKVDRAEDVDEAELNIPQYNNSQFHQ